MNPVENIDGINDTNEKGVYKIKFNGIQRALKIFKQNTSENSKEIAIHKSLNHDFIIGFIAEIKTPRFHGMILELAQYNLRSLIVPNLGLNPKIGIPIFLQVLEGIKYIHKKGICHRDVKPDNILLVGDGTVKLADFGCSTLFYYKKYRRLKKKTGTTAFMAPEVINEDYSGELADVWSLGITLLNLLTGKYPWDEAGFRNPNFIAYRQLKHHFYEPFNLVRDNILTVIEQMLLDENRRISIKALLQNKFLAQFTTDKESLMAEICGLKADSICFQKPNTPKLEFNFTLPEKCKNDAFNNQRQFSQPILVPDFQTLYRFYIGGDLLVSTKSLITILNQMRVAFDIEEQSRNTVINFQTVDTNNNKLTGEIKIQELNKTGVVTVQKGSGSLVEFKKFVIYIKGRFHG